MDLDDRMTQLDNALIDLIIVVTEGHWERLSAHIAPEVLEAGQRLKQFHESVINNRTF